MKIIYLLWYFRGSDTIVCKRYKQQLRRTIIESDPSPPPELARHLTTNPLGLHYLLIIDFEATCEAVNPPDYIHEIIEFPVLLFNMKTKEIVSWIASQQQHAFVITPEN